MLNKFIASSLNIIIIIILLLLLILGRMPKIFYQLIMLTDLCYNNWVDKQDKLEVKITAHSVYLFL